MLHAGDPCRRLAENNISRTILFYRPCQCFQQSNNHNIENNKYIISNSLQCTRGIVTQNMSILNLHMYEWRPLQTICMTIANDCDKLS